MGLIHIGQWDRFESSVTNPNHYADAYNDVTLNATYLVYLESPGTLNVSVEAGT